MITNQKVKRGRPRLSTKTPFTERRWKPQTLKMKNFKFDSSLFTPMSTNKRVDEILSAERGVMKGTNVAFIGDPGVGKTTVMLDIIADLDRKGKKVLFISGEMNQIDMVGYVKRFPKFGVIDILFMGDYVNHNPEAVIQSVLTQGWDVVLIDSMAEIVTAFVDHFGGTSKQAETKILNLCEKHNKAENFGKLNTTFLIIQQVTKGGQFAGSNRFKHMLTGMFEMRFRPDGSRDMFFTKNRRGGRMDRLQFGFNNSGHIHWGSFLPMNEE